MDHAVYVEIKLKRVKTADMIITMPIQNSISQYSSFAREFLMLVVMADELKRMLREVLNSKDMNTMLDAYRCVM